MTSEEQHDVVVVGGGVAGVNCALECFDIQLDTLLVEASAALGGQLPEILHSVRNVAAAFGCFKSQPERREGVQIRGKQFKRLRLSPVSFLSRSG